MKKGKKNVKVKGKAALRARTYEGLFGPITVRPSRETLEFWGLRPKEPAKARKGIQRSPAPDREPAPAC